MTKLVRMLSVLILTLVFQACGSSVEYSGQPAAPTPAAKSVQCEVFDIGASISTMPNLDLISSAFTLGLDSMAFAEVNEATPFAAFVGTPAAGVTKQFAMRCKTTFKADVAGNHKFTVSSDDGAKVYVNGILTINHDGLHGTTSKNSTINLAKGSYSIQVDYFQNLGQKSLKLTVQKPAAPVQTF